MTADRPARLDDKRCWTCDQRVEVVERGLTQHVVGLDAEALVTAGRTIEVLTGERDRYKAALVAIEDYDSVKLYQEGRWVDFDEHALNIVSDALYAAALAATSPREGA